MAKGSLAFLAVFLVAHAVLACGINWEEPHSKFEGCNEQGYVLLAEKLAELTLPGEKRPIPIWATFDSSRQTASPYAGMGWRIPFLESNMVQLSEDEFILTEPGGWKQLFRRAGKNSDLLNGGGWKGQLMQDRAILWADCGWRIDLYRGKIAQLKTPAGQAIVYNYSEGRLASITCGLQTLVAIDPAEGPDHTLRIVIEGKACYLAKTDQPRVQRIKDQNVIAGIDQSFVQLTGPDWKTRSFAYSVDDRVFPKITITDAVERQTSVSWDPETRRITRYGHWSYDIKPNGGPLENAAIGRTNDKGQREYWFYDGLCGQEKFQGIDGILHVITRFTSGKLVGRIRKEVLVDNGVDKLVRKLSYNETGELVRIETGDGLVGLFSKDF